MKMLMVLSSLGPFSVFYVSFMATRTWKILCWNVRGINSDKKWEAIRDRVFECSCDVICLQETKKESFDKMFINKICPPMFDAFDFIPSVGALGGSIII